jgi:hypothetical protein
LRSAIDGADWGKIYDRANRIESEGAITRAKERRDGKLSDLTGLGKRPILNGFAAVIKKQQSPWSRMSTNDRVKSIGAALMAVLIRAGVPALHSFRAENMKNMGGGFSPALWRMVINKDLVIGRTLTTDGAAELCNTLMHEARHAEQLFLAARYLAGLPAKKSVAEVAREVGIPLLIARAAVAAKFSATTNPVVAALGKKMYDAFVTKGKENQKITDDDYLAEMETARAEAIEAEKALRANATSATYADATIKLNNLKMAIAEVEGRYRQYRNIPYEADAHEVGIAAELTFKE